MTTALHTTREGWLTALAEAMRPHFYELGYLFPRKMRVAMSWPSRRATSEKNRCVDMCYPSTCSKDGTHEVMVSPVLDDPMLVADVLAHELVHAALNAAGELDHGHGALFAKGARALGLEGKPTATIAGEEFLAWAKPLVEALGPYPHASLDVTKNAAKKDHNRQLKVKCPECGYTCRTTRKWLDEVGPPICPCSDVEADSEQALPRMEEEISTAA